MTRSPLNTDSSQCYPYTFSLNTLTDRQTMFGNNNKEAFVMPFKINARKMLIIKVYETLPQIDFEIPILYATREGGP